MKTAFILCLAGLISSSMFAITPIEMDKGLKIESLKEGVQISAPGLTISSNSDSIQFSSVAFAIGFKAGADLSGKVNIVGEGVTVLSLDKATPILAQFFRPEIGDEVIVGAMGTVFMGASARDLFAVTDERVVAYHAATEAIVIWDYEHLVIKQLTEQGKVYDFESDKLDKIDLRTPFKIEIKGFTVEIDGINLRSANTQDLAVTGASVSVMGSELANLNILDRGEAGDNVLDRGEAGDNILDRGEAGDNITLFNSSVSTISVFGDVQVLSLKEMAEALVVKNFGTLRSINVFSGSTLGNVFVGKGSQTTVRYIGETEKNISK